MPRLTERGWEIPIEMLPERWRDQMMRRFSVDGWAGVIIIA